MPKKKEERTYLETKENFKRRLRKFIDPKLWKKYDLEDDDVSNR